MVRSFIKGVVFVIFSPVAFSNSDDISDKYLDLFTTSLPSTVTLEFGWDSTNTREMYLNFDIGLKSRNRLLFNAGRSSYRLDNSVKRTTSYLIGLGTDPLDTVSYSMTYDYWDQDQQLSADRVQGTLQWSPSNWQFSFMPEIRYISLRRKTSDLRLGIRNPGFGLAVAYLGFEKFTFSISRFQYQYSNNIDSLGTIPRILSNNLANEFDKTRTSLKADYNLSRGVIGIEWVRSVSAADLSVYRTTTFSALWGISDNWSLQGTLGHPSGALFKANYFASVGVGYSW